MSECRAWSEGDPILEEYHDREWCRVRHDDDFEFEMLCLEGASKRAAYRAAFHDFKIDACAAMSDAELEKLLLNPGIIRSRGKIFSVRKNALAVQQIRKEFGSFDAYLWGFADGQQIDGRWRSLAEVPTVSDVSKRMSADMKKRGMGFVGPVITYSFLQAVGIVRSAPCCSPLLFRKQVGQAVHARVSFSILPLPFGRTAPSDDGAAVFLQSAVSGGVGFARIAAGTAAAAAAGTAGTAAGAVAAAGAFPRFSVTDHAADQQHDDHRDRCDENNIHKIGGKPAEHGITSFVKWQRCEERGRNCHSAAGRKKRVSY